MNKKQITVTIIALLFFVGVFMGSQNSDYVKDLDYSTSFRTHRVDSTNVGFLIGGWIATGVVWLGLMAMLKSKPNV